MKKDKDNYMKSHIKPVTKTAVCVALFALSFTIQANASEDPYVQFVRSRGREMIEVKCIKPDCTSPKIEAIKALPKTIKVNDAEWNVSRDKATKPSKNRFGYVESCKYVVKDFKGDIATGSLIVYPDAVAACEVPIGLAIMRYAAPIELIAGDYGEMRCGSIVVVMRKSQPDEQLAFRTCSVIFRNVAVMLTTKRSELKDSDVRDLAIALLRSCCPEAAAAIDKGEPQSCSEQKL